MGEKVLYEVVSKTDSQQNGDPQLPEAAKAFGARHMQVLILFICLTMGYMQRANLSVSMVAMTSHDDLIECLQNIHKNSVNKSENFKTSGNFTNDTTVISVNENCKSKELSKWSVYRKYDWNQSVQEMIVFSFFLGYTTMQLPMGLLAQKFGGKKPIMMALAVNGVLSLVTPWLPIVGGWLAMCSCRLIQGMTQAAFYPSIHTLLAKWSPLSERGRLSTYIYTGYQVGHLSIPSLSCEEKHDLNIQLQELVTSSYELTHATEIWLVRGSQFGTIVIFQISGLFAGSPSFGWPATFWFCGILSLASFGLLAWLGAASPHEHPNITVEEMAFIMEGCSADVVPKKRRTPWKHILSSSAVWALVATHAGSAAGHILVLTQIPTYMNHVLGVDIKNNGLLSSLPYVAMYFTALSCGWLADYMANKNILTVINIRRIANTTGMVVSGCFLIGFSYISSTTPAVIMLVFTLSFHSAVHVGFHINQIDLAPNFAGNIMALGNMVANLTSLLVPVIVSNVVKDDTSNQHKWQIVFLIFVGGQFVTNTIFVTFCKANVQPWNFYGIEGNEIEREEAKALDKKTSLKHQDPK